MRFDPRTIDVGIRDAVLLLNRVPGVATRASCQGAGRERPTHRHADLAYVLFHFPLPLRLQDFLAAQLARLARIEDDGIYTRWPADNRAFLDGLTSATRVYLNQVATKRSDSVAWPLPRLRSRMARLLSYNQDADVGFCCQCRELVTEPHVSSHRPLPLLHLSAQCEAEWFAEFASHHPNALDPALVDRDGWSRITARTVRGDFGSAFQRRWLRYRTRQLTALGTVHIRNAVRDARCRGSDLEFYYSSTHAVLAWCRDE